MSCSFCKCADHRISRCPIKDALGPVQDCDQLIAYILNTSPFCKLDLRSYKDIIATNISGSNGSRHIVLHQIHTKYAESAYSRPTKEGMVVTITLLDQYGQPIRGYNRAIVEMTRVIDYIYKHKGKQRRFVFSSILKESIGPQFQTTGQNFNEQRNDACNIGPPRNPYVIKTKGLQNNKDVVSLVPYRVNNPIQQIQNPIQQIQNTVPQIHNCDQHIRNPYTPCNPYILNKK